MRWKNGVSLLAAAMLLAGTARVRKSAAAAWEDFDGDATTAKAHEVAKGNVLPEALLTELDRSKDRLKMDQVKSPYYIEYRVEDVENYDAEPAFAALLHSHLQHIPVLR